MNALDRHLSRRQLLASGIAVGAAGAIGLPSLRATPRAAAAPVPTRPATRRLVVVFLRGAADHLSITVPLDEAYYHDARPGVAVPAVSTLPLDDRFGFHPALRRLHERYLAGVVAPVVAVGNPAGDRSHFVAQDLLERGSTGDGELADGWLARCLTASSTAGDSPLRAVTVGANVDDSLVGYPALGMRSLRSFGFGAAGAGADALAEAMRAAHVGNDAIDDVALRAMQAADAVADLPGSVARDATTAAFEDIATLLDADLGVETITVSIDGWDTHDRMGTIDEGDMLDVLDDLDAAVGGLTDELDSRGIDDVTTLVVTEFGRRVAENGSGGTDHGWGSAALVIGNDVEGGRVHGDWPGLDPDVVNDARGDVPMTTDFRDLLSEVVTGVLGGDASATFPGHSPVPVGVVTGST